MSRNRPMASHSLKFDKFDPKEVYGSYAKLHMQDDKLKNTDHEDTNVAKDMLNMKRKSSLEFDNIAKVERLSNSEADNNDSVDHQNSADSCYENIYIKPLEQKGLKEEGCNEESHVNLFFGKDDIKHIEVIRLRAYYLYYHKIDSLYQDIMDLLKYTISTR